MGNKLNGQSFKGKPSLLAAFHIDVAGGKRQEIVAVICVTDTSG
jgi:hypothetical protein